MRRILGKIFLAFFCISFSFSLFSYAFGTGIIILGDSQHNPEIQRKLVQEILPFKPTIVFRTGDLVDNGNNPKLWKAFNNVNEQLLKTTEYFSALGNHEFHSPLYFENFPALRNRRWYSVRRMGIHFIILDSNSRLDLESEQYKWLVSDLAVEEETDKFTIVIFHHPLFDVSQVHKSDEKNLKPVLLPLFARYGVAAVFSGHSHDYQRFEYNGIYFIVTGGGGSNLYSQSRTNPYLQKFIMAYHFCHLTVEDGFLKVRGIGIDSNIIDDFIIPARDDKYAVP